MLFQQEISEHKQFDSLIHAIATETETDRAYSLEIEGVALHGDRSLVDRRRGKHKARHAIGAPLISSARTKEAHATIRRDERWREIPLLPLFPSRR